MEAREVEIEFKAPDHCPSGWLGKEPEAALEQRLMLPPDVLSTRLSEHRR